VKVVIVIQLLSLNRYFLSKIGGWKFRLYALSLARPAG
jgi:hypothetical protein